jgi:hypothetical protein
MFPEDELAEFCRSFFRLARMEEKFLDLLGDDTVTDGRGIAADSELFETARVPSFVITRFLRAV